MFMNESDVAPSILPNGDRRTTEICFNCGMKRYYDRTQEKFTQEMKNLFIEHILKNAEGDA